MCSNNSSYWKRLWRWTTSGTLSSSELMKVFDSKEFKDQLRLGLNNYKSLSTNNFTQLQQKYPEQTKLLNVVQTLQNYMDIDCFQIWEVIKHYLCDISYGTPENALKNVAFVDTRPSYLLPKIWNFYYKERLFLLKLLHYIIDLKDNDSNKYKEQFTKIITDIGIDNIKKSLVAQFEKVLLTAPPSRKIYKDFSSDTIGAEWVENNLREQIAILQCLLLIADKSKFSSEEFNKLFDLFRKHDLGRRPSYNDLLEERHRELCLKVTLMEVALFIIICDPTNITNVTQWIENTKQGVENEVTKLQINQEHSVMLISWMMLTLQSEQHSQMFESHYQHFGATALKLRVFEYLHNMVKSELFSDDSKCAKITRNRILSLLNTLCDKFDGDGTLSHQAGMTELCAELFQYEDIATQFWTLHCKDDVCGVVSLWHTALEFFPYNFNALSTLAASLAKAGKDSVRSLIAELKSLPVYTEVYNPNLVPVMSLTSDDVVISKDYFPLGGPNYHIEVNSTATIMERRDLTLIHFKTPYSYWTILTHEIEKSLDRKDHQRNLNETLQRVYEGAKVLKNILKTSKDMEMPKSLVLPSEGIFEVLIRFIKTDATPLPLIVECFKVCSALINIFPKEIHLRLINTGLLPRIINTSLTHLEYANGVSFDSGAVGAYLITLEQSSGSYDFLIAYIDLLCNFLESIEDDRIATEVILPGVILIVREVFPNINGWRYVNLQQRLRVAKCCVKCVNLMLQQTRSQSERVKMLQKVAVFSFLYTENSLELLKIVSIGNDQLEQMITNDTNWISGNGIQYTETLQRAIAIVMLIIKLKNTVTENNEMTPLEHLIFAQNQLKNGLKFVPKVTSYINNAFNNNLAVLCCSMLKKFAEGFQMSLFASLDMTAYQVRVIFLDRLKDVHETIDLKVAILDFVATCVGKQPGLTEAFFKLNLKAKVENNEVKVKKEDDDSFEGILGYMAEYLGMVKSDPALLHSPLLAGIMALFHALWKNNMQILVKDLRQNPKFWECLTSPLFSEIQPGLRTYAQIFNVLGIELFISRDKIDTNLKEILELFFDTNKTYLDKWINYIFAFKGRGEELESIDKVPTWLGLLTSWKDFTTIFCKCLPINLNIAHKAKVVAPCIQSLLNELDDFKDGRLVVILAELYVTMMANWKDDCFDNRKTNTKQIDQLLTNTTIVYECLHPRAKKAILSIGTVAISSLDYEIKASSETAQNVIRAVTNINSLELEKLFDEINEGSNTEKNEQIDEIPPVVLSLALLEQCLELYDDIFPGLSQWFQTTRFTNKLLSCLQNCLQNRRYYHVSLAALRCLTAYARGPFSKELLFSDMDQFLWLQLLPPKFENDNWKVEEWWRVYAYSLDFITVMVMKNGQFYATDAITFIGVHLEHIIEAILLPRQIVTLDSLNLCASTLNLIVQLVKFEGRWRMENINSLIGVMRSIGACLHQCVIIILKSRRSSTENTQLSEDSQQHSNAVVHKTLEILHMSTLSLLAFSPDLLSLLADPGLDLERWQPLVDIDFAVPKHGHEELPQLTFGTLLTIICVLTRSLNHMYHSEESLSGSRSPRSGRRRACSCSSPGARAESVASGGSGVSGMLPAPARRSVTGALEATLALAASQALLAVRDKTYPSRHKQLIRRELSSEITVFHDFVRKRILCAAHAHPQLMRNKLGSWPLAPNEEETKLLRTVLKKRNPECDDDELPPPPPPKRASHDSMREYILRKHYLDKCAQTPTKEPPSPVSHSTPTSDKKKEASRSSKRVSWAETTQDSEDDIDSQQIIDQVYSNLTDVQINNDEDFFHFMSVVFLCICQVDM